MTKLPETLTLEALSATPWHVENHNPYVRGWQDWQSFTVRDAHNHCLAIVGDVDRATAPFNFQNASIMAEAAALLIALRRCKEIAEDGSRPYSARNELIRDHVTPILCRMELLLKYCPQTRQEEKR